MPGRVVCRRVPVWVVRVQASKILACVDPVPLEILPQERAQLLPFVGSLGLSGLVVVLLQAVGTSLSFRRGSG